MEIRRISEVLKAQYGEKVYRLSLSSGCSCPNRDGHIMTGGCTFCSEGGSGEFAERAEDIAVQLRNAKRRIEGKTDAKKYIAYFQSFSNTYGDPKRLGRLFRAAIAEEDVVILAIATRPDCLPSEILALLEELNGYKPVWVELGLQTASERTAEKIHRGYPLAVFEKAYAELKARGIAVIVHTIFGLPGEREEDMLGTIRYLASLTSPPEGIKFQMLNVLRGSLLAEEYLRAPFPLLTREEYGALLVKSLKLLPPETAVHRLTGDGPKNLLLAPLWCADKKKTLNTLNRMIREA